MADLDVLDDGEHRVPWRSGGQPHSAQRNGLRTFGHPSQVYRKANGCADLRIAHGFGTVRRVDAPALSYPILNTIALEYHVTVELDGVTLSPPFAVPPDPAARTDRDSQAVLVGDTEATLSGRRVLTVERLGLVDLTGYLQGGATADRIVRSILVVGPTPVPGGVVADIGRIFDGTPDTEGRIVIPVGANGIESDNCIYVPQTAQLQLRGLTATPGNPILVRILVWQPQTVEELAEMVAVCCCRASAIDDEGEPFFTTALYVGAACGRTVIAIAPPGAPAGTGTVGVAITGSGFAEGDLVFFVHEDGIGTLAVESVIVMNPNNMAVIVNVPVGAALGAYNVIVTPPLAPPQCQGIGEGLFVVI